MKRRKIALLGVVVVAVLLAVAGLSAAAVVKSPQEQAALAREPKATALTATVERRVLKQSVVLRADIVAGMSVEVTPSAKAGGKAVITAVRTKVGAALKAGQVILEVAGRPLVVLPGAKPAYRDLRPGYAGEDVTQLQKALAGLGYPTYDVIGTFGASTKRALNSFYAKIGYPASPTGEDDDAQLAAASKTVKGAQRALDDARETLAKAPAAERAAAAKAVERAKDDLADARKSQADLVAKTGPTLPLSEYVFLPAFPARVDALNAEVGAEATAPTVTLASGPLRAKAYLTAGQRGSLKRGMPVEIAAEALGETAQGAIESIGEFHNDKTNPANTGYPLVVTPGKALDQRLAGQNVRLTIAAATSEGPVLVVPVAAIFSGADGRAYVIRRGGNGQEERVSVMPGLQGEGFVALTGGLQPGDRVVVGVAGS